MGSYYVCGISKKAGKPEKLMLWGIFSYHVLYIIMLLFS